MSKRKLQQLVQNHLVDGWDDPRLPTIAGLRRRGYTPYAIRDFCERIGVARRDTITDHDLLEFCVREDLNQSALRRIAVVRPLKVILSNYEQVVTEYITLENLPGEQAKGSREVPFGKELWIERNDFMEHPGKNYFRLAPGRMVRLKGAYIIVCEHIVKDQQGNITELHCKYFPDTKSGKNQGNLKVKSTIHWLSIPHAVPAEIRLYDKLFNVEDPDQLADHFIDHFNNNSVQILQNAYVEKDLLTQDYSGIHFQFIRLGYFIKDKNSKADRLIFNRTVDLKDSRKKT
jgi:glutaminyl-tRNA synthetase